MTIALYLLGGLILLLLGGEALVRGAGRLALRLGMPPVLIALTVVAFGSSAPELIAGLVASSRGQVGIVVGNVFGSNLANIALVIGLAALLRPIHIHPRLMRSELPLLLLLQGGMFFLALADQRLSRWDGAVLLMLGFLYVGLILRVARRPRESTVEVEGATADLGLALEVPIHGSLGPAVLLTVVGLVLLPMGANWFVAGAVDLARSIGLSERVIGLTVVSLGTSAPEIATTLIAVARKDFGLAAGTVMGSNVFNLCYVLGFCAVLFPFDLGVLEPDKVQFDLWATLGLTVLLYGFCAIGRVITRSEGLILLATYAAVIAYSVH